MRLSGTEDGATANIMDVKRSDSWDFYLIKPLEVVNDLIIILVSGL